MHENNRKKTKSTACNIMLRFVDRSTCFVSLMILAHLLVPENYRLVFIAILYAVLFRFITLSPLRFILGQNEGADSFILGRIAPQLQSLLSARHQTSGP